MPSEHSHRVTLQYPMSNVQSYADKTPKALRLALNSIAGEDNIGYAIVMLLVENHQLTEDDITNELCTDNDDVPDARITELKAKISKRIDDLQRGGVIQRHPGERIGDPNTGTYSLTNFGEALLDGLYDATTTDSQPHTASNEVIDQRFRQSVTPDETTGMEQ